MDPTRPNPDLGAFDLHGRIALVTGASAGIGLHLAGVLARAGASVALTARREDKVVEAARRLSQEGHRAVGVALDVNRTDTHERSFRAIEAALGGKPDILLNNAGVFVSKPFLEQTEAEVSEVLDTNLLGAFLVAQRAARGMVELGRGSIINVASSAGIMVSESLSSYSAAKAGLVQLTKVMALELARHGIRVNALCPGNIVTDMLQTLLDRGLEAAVVKRVPQRYLGKVDDLSGATLLLASDAGRYITGAVISVDGGRAIG